jgi:hypothetical protein
MGPVFSVVSLCVREATSHHNRSIQLGEGVDASVILLGVYTLVRMAVALDVTRQVPRLNTALLELLICEQRPAVSAGKSELCSWER